MSAYWCYAVPKTSILPRSWMSQTVSIIATLWLVVLEVKPSIFLYLLNRSYRLAAGTFGLGVLTHLMREVIWRQVKKTQLQTLYWALSTTSAVFSLCLLLCRLGNSNWSLTESVVLLFLCCCKTGAPIMSKSIVFTATLICWPKNIAVSELFTMTLRSNFLECLCGLWGLHRVHMCHINKKTWKWPWNLSTVFCSYCYQNGIVLWLYSARRYVCEPASLLGCGMNICKL